MHLSFSQRHTHSHMQLSHTNVTGTETTRKHNLIIGAALINFPTLTHVQHDLVVQKRKKRQQGNNNDNKTNHPTSGVVISPFQEWGKTETTLKSIG